MRHQHDPDVSIYAYRAMNARHAMTDGIGLFYGLDDPCGCLDAPGDLPAGSTVDIDCVDAGIGHFASPTKAWRI